VHQSHIGDELIAYHEARARSGVGMIMTEVCSGHNTYDPPNRISLTADEYIPSLKKLTDVCHGYDCTLLTQLFHPSRVPAQSVDCSRPVAYGPSEVMDERYRYQPHPLSMALIEEFVEAGRRTYVAGCDGVEIVASMRYFVTQFMNLRINLRSDIYGDGLAGRLKFLRDTITTIRRKTSDAFLIGIRISANEMDHEGLKSHEVGEICQSLDGDRELDFINVIAGSVFSVAGWTHAVPPMFVEQDYLAPHARLIKDTIDLPVFVAGRINQPHTAEEILLRGDADLCDLVRTNICDPEFANKARTGRSENIRTCMHRVQPSLHWQRRG
jgi:2,4-dienoyl-CoA reductase-like NADH-dependent reductase (Old Yellow Enzyme family)